MLVTFLVSVFLSMPAAASEETASASEDAAVDIDAGGDLYKKQCRRCHGPTAKGLASYPSLRDQSPDYLIEKLTAYRAGKRFGPNTPLMAPQAKRLSDEDIAQISHFIASLD